jgi:hypothetical protein
MIEEQNFLSGLGFESEKSSTQTTPDRVEPVKIPDQPYRGKRAEPEYGPVDGCPQCELGAGACRKHPLRPNNVRF